MHRIAAFFGGIAAGGVISAACGFDLFEADRTQEAQAVVDRLKAEAAGTRDRLKRAEELLRESSQKSQSLQEKLASCESQVSAIKVPEAARLQGEAARARAEASELRSTLARTQLEADAGRKALLEAHRVVEDLRQLLHDQVLAFFARERDEWDAGLVSSYLKSEASRDSQKELLLALIERNKPLLLHLTRQDGPGTARIEPAVAPGGTAEPRNSSEGTNRP